MSNEDKSSLAVAIRKQVQTVPQALSALAAMERQLTAAETYEDLQRIIKEASALKILMRDVDAVKVAAENAILLGNKRIAEEFAKVPKAAGRPAKNLPPQGKNKAGREATGIKHSTRSRLGKLADKSDAEIKATAAKLREQGKDATVTAVVRELTQGGKKQRRDDRERTLGKKQIALPDKRYGVFERTTSGIMKRGVSAARIVTPAIIIQLVQTRTRQKRLSNARRLVFSVRRTIACCSCGRQCHTWRLP